jgi:hypothetical protein
MIVTKIIRLLMISDEGKRDQVLHEIQGSLTRLHLTKKEKFSGLSPNTGEISQEMYIT